jgi:hypothetical protein
VVASSGTVLRSEFLTSGRCSKGSWGAWAGDVVGVFGVRARWSTVVCGLHGAARGSERVEGTVRSVDGSGQRDRERGRRKPASTDRPPPGRGRARARAHTRVVADRWDPPVIRRGRACGLAGLDWASWDKITFLFSSNF